MQDYKFDLKLNGQRGKSRRRAGVFIAASMLAGTLAALGFHDTDASLTAFSDTHSQPSPQETRLQAQTPQPIRMALPLPAPGHDQAPVAEAAHEDPRPAAPAQGPSLLQPDAIKTAPVIKHLTKPAPTGNAKAAQTAGNTTATLLKAGAVSVDPKPVAVATAEPPSQSARPAGKNTRSSRANRSPASSRPTNCLLSPCIGSFTQVRMRSPCPASVPASNLRCRSMTMEHYKN